MGPEALLQMACELSYVIARQGVESEPPIEAPAGMRSFLYAVDLPTEAFDAAREAIEADPAFRRRVAEQASQDQVGRVGYIWLHRPIGWAGEFEELTAAAQIDPPGFDEPVETVPAIEDVAQTTLDYDYDDDRDEVDDDPGDELSDDLDAEDATANEADAFEDELTSLRGLVDRLASERKAVSTSVERVEQQVQSARMQPSSFDSDIYTLQSELESALTELESARADRDQAVQQHSAALTRQLQLEKELDRARELQAEIDAGHAESDAKLVEVQEALARVQADIGPMTAEREQLVDQVAELQAANGDLTAQVEQLTSDRRSISERADRQELELRTETEALRSERAALEETLALSRADLRDTSQHLETAAKQALEAKELTDVLTGEKIEVASRLADTEVMLENTRTQLSAVKADLSAVSADLATMKTHRDGLSSQVEELHGSLGEALSNLAKVRSISDTDRAGLKEVRTERDLLKVRLSSLEQVESGLETKLETMATERDALLFKIDELTTEFNDADRRLREAVEAQVSQEVEIGQLQMVNAELTGSRDRFQAEAERLRSDHMETERTRDALAQQVDQLTAENSAIQDQLVESDRLRVETSESQGHALSELAHRLAIVEDERSRLVADLKVARRDLDQARTELDEAKFAGLGATSGDALVLGSLATGDASPETDTETAGFDPTDLDPDPGAESPSDVLSELSGSGSLLDSDPSDGVDVPGLFAGEEQDGETSDADEIVGETDGSAEDDDSFARATRRHSWSLGPLLRSGSRSKKSDDDETIEAGDIESMPPPPLAANDELDSVAAALAEAGPFDAPEVVEEAPVDDLKAMSSDLADAIEQADDPLPSADDELDAIGDLIAKTVTHFDSDDPGAEVEASTAGSEVTDDDTSAWKLIEPDESAEDADQGTPSRGNGAMTPPSVFNDGDDPFASLDQFEAVTIRPGEGDSADEPSDPAKEPDTMPAVFADLSDDAESGPITGLGMIDKLIEGEGSDEGSNGDSGDSGVVSPVGTDSGDADSTGARSRRQVAIPPELMDDEVELARHVVSSPDVVLLVDGDSVAKMGWPSLPVAQQRDALVSYLADLATSTGAAPDVVFDGRIGEEESLPASRAVRIRLSTPPTAPAAALDELVDAYPEQWPIAVVTDDDTLAASAVDRGAVVLNNGQLLDLFISQ